MNDLTGVLSVYGAIIFIGKISNNYMTYEKLMEEERDLKQLYTIQTLSNPTYAHDYAESMDKIKREKAYAK